MQGNWTKFRVVHVGDDTPDECYFSVIAERIDGVGFYSAIRMFGPDNLLTHNDVALRNYIHAKCELAVEKFDRMTTEPASQECSGSFDTDPANATPCEKHADLQKIIEEEFAAVSGIQKSEKLCKVQ